MVSIHGEHKPYTFPEPVELKLCLADMLESEVDEKFYLSEEQIARITFSSFNQERARIQDKSWADTLTARDYKGAKCIDLNQIGRYDTPTRKNSSRYRVYDPGGLSPSLTCSQGGNLQPHIPVERREVRRLTPKEYWRLMGISDDTFLKAEKVCSNTQLYKQAGNGIVVNVLEELLRSLL